MEPRTCVVCGKGYTPYVENQLVCGEICRREMTRRRDRDRDRARYQADAEFREKIRARRREQWGKTPQAKRDRAYALRRGEAVSKPKPAPVTKVVDIEKPPLYIPPACVVCSAVFHPRHVKQFYCSQKCCSRMMQIRRGLKRLAWLASPERAAIVEEKRRRATEREASRMENARRTGRIKYATDPYYRQRMLDRDRERYAADPDYKATRAARKRKYRAEKRRKAILAGFDELQRTLTEERHERDNNERRGCG